MRHNSKKALSTRKS